jgi:hypothetical protein
MAGSNIIEFRIARKFTDESKTVQADQRLQFRTKDVLISILGIISLGVWSEWKDFDSVEIVDVVEPS